MNRLSVSRRTHYTTLAAIYVWSAIFGLPYVKERNVYRYTRTLFLVFNSGFYRVFMVAVAVGHMILTFWVRRKCAPRIIHAGSPLSKTSGTGV